MYTDHSRQCLQVHHLFAFKFTNVKMVSFRDQKSWSWKLWKLSLQEMAILFCAWYKVSEKRI